MVTVHMITILKKEGKGKKTCFERLHDAHTKNPFKILSLFSYSITQDVCRELSALLLLYCAGPCHAYLGYRNSAETVPVKIFFLAVDYVGFGQS